MERKIKFRAMIAPRKDSKYYCGEEWTYGIPLPSQLIGRGWMMNSYAISEVYYSKHASISVKDLITIDEDTIGQFTGLYDKKGVEIYEGDIVKTKFERICIIKWNSSPNHIGFDLKPIETEHPYPDEYDLYQSDNLEVIGNIYDNPELLK